MKILRLIILGTTAFFLVSCAAKKEIPSKSPCACEYDIIKTHGKIKRI